MRRTRAHLRGKDVGGRICAGSERHREQLVRHLPRLGTPLEALEPRVRLPDLRRRLRTESRAELVDHPESGVVHCLHVLLVICPFLATQENKWPQAFFTTVGIRTCTWLRLDGYSRRQYCRSSYLELKQAQTTSSRNPGAAACG